MVVVAELRREVGSGGKWVWAFASICWDVDGVGVGTAGVVLLNSPAYSSALT